MAIGKREQIVGLSIGVLVSIFLIHMFIFKPRADEFADVHARFIDGVNQLQNAEVPVSPSWLKKENEKTATFRSQITSVTAQLNVDVPAHFAEDKAENFEKRYNELLGLMKQLVQMRQTMQQPRLTFLGDRRSPQNPWDQLGWNIPTQLSELPLFQGKNPVQAKAQLWDMLTKLESFWNVANAIADPQKRMQYRTQYNEYMSQLGMNPAELSSFIYRPDNNTAVFFNDKETYEKFGTRAIINPLSLSRYGVLLPELKKIWMLELIWEQRDANTRTTKEKLWSLFEINMPFDERMLLTVKQLQALIDIIRLAQKASVQEITQVHLLKPTQFAKTEPRVPGKTPEATPSPTPGVASPMMAGEFGMLGGMGTPVPTPAGEAVARGAGLEIYFLASNPSTFDFLFDITTMPRTYALDDLYIQALQGTLLRTSTTVEMVMRLEETPAAGEPEAEQQQ